MLPKVIGINVPLSVTRPLQPCLMAGSHWRFISLCWLGRLGLVLQLLWLRLLGVPVPHRSPGRCLPGEVCVRGQPAPMPRGHNGEMISHALHLSPLPSAKFSQSFRHSSVIELLKLFETACPLMGSKRPYHKQSRKQGNPCNKHTPLQEKWPSLNAENSPGQSRVPNILGACLSSCEGSCRIRTEIK